MRILFLFSFLFFASFTEAQNKSHFDLGEYIYYSLDLDDMWFSGSFYLNPETVKAKHLKSFEANGDVRKYSMSYDTLQRCIVESDEGYFLEQNRKERFEFTYDSALTRKGITRINRRIDSHGEKILVPYDTVLISCDQNGRPLRLHSCELFSFHGPDMRSHSDIIFSYHNNGVFESATAFLVGRDTMKLWELKYFPLLKKLYFEGFITNSKGELKSSGFKEVSHILRSDSMEYGFTKDASLEMAIRYPGNKYCLYPLWTNRIAFVYPDSLLETWDNEGSGIGIDRDSDGHVISIYDWYAPPLDTNYHMQPDISFIYNLNGLPASQFIAHVQTGIARADCCGITLFFQYEYYP